MTNLPKDGFAQKLHKLYETVETCYRPDLRWWLAEGLNTDETLKKNVQQIYDSGFGAAEFLAMPEPGADSSIYGWGSEEWTSDTRLIVEEATRLGLGFSLTSGSHWANANLPDTYVWKGVPYSPDNTAAAKELDYATIRLKAGEHFCGSLPLPKQVEAVSGDIHGTASTYKEQLFQGVIAAKLLKPREQSGQEFDFGQGTGTGILAFETLADLSGMVQQDKGNYSLDWTAPQDGEYALFVYWMHGTGQTASPSVSTNYTINYVDKYGVQALIDYWEEIVLTDSLRETIRKNGRGEIYMDSLELVTYGAGGIFWGYDLREEFRRRKGYDVLPYLPLLTMDGIRCESRKSKQYDYQPQSDEGMLTARKVRMDFYSILSDMYAENVLKPLQEWLHSLGMTLRAEPSYGMPYEISVPAKYIDGVETESFAQLADIDLYRGMSGAANLYGKIFSSETGAVHAHNYFYNMDDWTQLCYLQFAEGVNRTVFHGYSAIEGSEQDTYWPGHEGMYAHFSERFNSRQPASIHYPVWTEMLGRIQKAMRQGTAVRDIAVLRTDYFFINYGQPKGRNTFADNFSMYGTPYFFQDLSLQQAGYTYDYFSPLLLEDDSNISWTAKSLQPNGPDYRAVIVYQEMLELSAAKKLLEIASGGLPVVFVNNNTEILCHDGAVIRNGKAASVSRYFGDSDSELNNIVSQIKQLSNVQEVNSPAETLSALQSLGVEPRAAFAQPNDKILTASRLDGENHILYLFAYSYKFAVEKDAPPCSFTLNIEGEGIPYTINAWNGDINKLGLYSQENGKTCIPLSLQPGEHCLLALDLNAEAPLHAVSSSANAVFERDGALYIQSLCSGTFETTLDNGKTVCSDFQVYPAVDIPRWDITVQDWNEGERMVNYEEKFGHRTTEVYYTTKKTSLEFSSSPLMPWKDLPASAEQLACLAGGSPSMSHVSGVGIYKSSFVLPDGWKDSDGAYLEMGSAGGGSVRLEVNGRPVLGVDIRTLRADISEFVKPGENTVCIEVASTLTNRMIQRGYQDKNSGLNEDFPQVQAYGLTGNVRVVPYSIKKIAEI